MSDRGRGAGISVGIDWPRPLDADRNQIERVAKFEGTATGFDFSQNVETQEDGGRGDGQVPPPLPLYTDGGLVVSLEYRRDAWPSPINFQGEKLTVKLMNDLRDGGDGVPAVFCTVEVIVVGQTVHYDEREKKAVWSGKLTCRITATPVWTGWGYNTEAGRQDDQPVPAEQSYPKKELWAGVEKTYDPHGILTSARQRIRLFAVADNDASEIQTLAATIADVTAPIVGLKRRQATIVRRNAKVCIVDVTWGLTDTKDDQTFPHEITNETVDGIGQSATRANLNTAPADPTTTNVFFAGKQTLRLNDLTTKIVNTYDEWGGEKNRRELEGSYVRRDPTGLGDEGAMVEVFKTADGFPADPILLPSGLKIVARTPRNFTLTHSEAVFSLAIDDSQQTLEQQASERHDDPNHIDSSRRTGTLDSIPSVETGFRDLGYDTKLVRHNRTMYIRQMGKLDSLDRLKLPRTKTKVDRDGSSVTSLDDIDVEVKEWLTTDTPPTAPDYVPTNNTKLLYYIDEPVYPAIDAVAGLNVRVFFYGSKSSRDELVLANEETTTDVSGLGSVAVRAGLDGETITDPGGNFVLRDTKTRNLSTGLLINRVLTVKIYGLTTREQDIQNEGTVSEYDPLKKRRRTTSVVAWSGTAPDLADSVNTANKLDKTFRGVSAQLLNSQKARQTIVAIEEDGLKHSMYGDVDLVSLRGKPTNGWPGGFGDGAALVHFKAPGIIVGGPALFTSGSLMPVFKYRARGGFHLRRCYANATPGSKAFNNLRGAVCNAVFLDEPQYSVMFATQVSEWIYPSGSGHVLVVDYRFNTDSLLWINDGNMPKDDVFFISGGATGSGFVPATLFDVTALLDWPAPADFSVFLT